MLCHGRGDTHEICLSKYLKASLSAFHSQCKCDCQLKELSFLQTRAHENSSQDQRDPNSAQLSSKPMEKNITSQTMVKLLMPRPSSAEKKEHVMKLSKAFNQIKLLDTSFSSEEEFGQKPSMKGTEQGKILHLTNRQRDLNHHTKKNPIVTFSARRKLDTAAKARTSLINLNKSASDQALGVNSPFQTPTSPSSIHSKSNSSSVTNSQTSNIPKGRNPSEADSRAPLPEKSVLPKVGRTNGANITNFSQGATCKPRTDIVFLKVHKSASSTVINILFRFGENHNLTFAFPINGAYQLNYPHYFTAGIVEQVPPSNDSKFNIMCLHMRFFKPEVRDRSVPQCCR